MTPGTNSEGLSPPTQREKRVFLASHQVSPSMPAACGEPPAGECKLIRRGGQRRWALTRTSPAAALVAALVVVSVAGCAYVDEQVTAVRIKLLGIEVCEAEKESAEWVLLQVLEAMNDKDSEAGWERFQEMLHSKERSPNSLRGWHQMGWRRMRKQKSHYLNAEGCYNIVKLRKIESALGELRGVEYYIESNKKDMGTPCAVYTDKDNKSRWRIKRCSL